MPETEGGIEPPDGNWDDVSEGHFAAIGRIAVEWSGLETTIDSRTMGLAGLDARIGACLTTQIAGSARKLDAYIALAKVLGAQKSSGKLEKFSKKTAIFSERRNRVIHDPWVGSQTPHRLNATARKTLKLEFVAHSTTELVQLANEINALHHEFADLNSAVRIEIASLRETPAQASP